MKPLDSRIYLSIVEYANRNGRATECATTRRGDDAGAIRPTETEIRWPRADPGLEVTVITTSPSSTLVRALQAELVTVARRIAIAIAIDGAMALIGAGSPQEACSVA